MNNYIHLVIHYDPVVTDDPELDRLRTVVAEILKNQDSRITIHDFRMVHGEKRTNVLFDVAIPFDAKCSKQDILTALEERIAEIDKKYCPIITIEHTILS